MFLIYIILGKHVQCSPILAESQYPEHQQPEANWNFYNKNIKESQKIEQVAGKKIMSRHQAAKGDFTSENQQPLRSGKNEEA